MQTGEFLFTFTGTNFNPKIYLRYNGRIQYIGSYVETAKILEEIKRNYIYYRITFQNFDKLAMFYVIKNYDELSKNVSYYKSCNEETRYKM